MVRISYGIDAFIAKKQDKVHPSGSIRHRHCDAPSNLNELAKNIRRGWKKLGRDTEYLAKLTYSMQIRIEVVIVASDDVTK